MLEAAGFKKNGQAVVLGGATIAGFFAAACSLPFDFVKTRIQKMEPLPDGTLPYKGPLDCAVKTFTKEGPLKFYTGFPTYCVRCCTGTQHTPCMPTVTSIQLDTMTANCLTAVACCFPFMINEAGGWLLPSTHINIHNCTDMPCGMFDGNTLLRLQHCAGAFEPLQSRSTAWCTPSAVMHTD